MVPAHQRDPVPLKQPPDTSLPVATLIPQVSCDLIQRVQVGQATETHGNRFLKRDA